ncbi:GNAT family N-acetyltransferase [Microbacterium sp. RG1]|uniref:GNAT family N-acetyltransferase n=1 Tax=Microbacterium sp. RG1 TaxID=2489212 RepID=UPI001EE363CA|nr:GNAT family N-acetyltransferase [Microbacterium sp. RG1]
MFRHELDATAYLSPLEIWQAEEFADHLDRAREFIRPWVGPSFVTDSVEGATATLARYADSAAADGGRLYGIWVDGVLRGGVMFVSFSAAAGVCEIGCWLEPAAEGRGLVMRAVCTLLDWALLGLRNMEIALTPPQLLANIHAVQRARGLTLSTDLKDPIKKSAAPINLDVEMETGTGKTYVYIKTIMELHKRYGWSKYIVVVPSIAIREGVKKSFDITAEHFQQLYGTKPRTFIYNSSRLHEIERFSSDAGVQVMIINVQAFNATGKDARRIYEVLDDFQSRKPIDVIAANRPILIIDEPQKIEGDAKKPSKSLETLTSFNALFALRYSATHRIERTKVHRLDAIDAYNQKLVKKIAVRGITVKHLAGSGAYLYIDGLEIGKGADFPKARVELEVQTAQGIKRQVKRLSRRANLHDISGGIEAYKGLFIRDVDAIRDRIELSNGEYVGAGEVTEDVAEDQKRRIQIREVIRAHLAKERELFAQGIKTLSLFFIDEVAKYRD